MEFTPKTYFDFYGEAIGRCLCKRVYTSDSCAARATRIFIAIPWGIIKGLLRPFACIVGLIIMPPYALYKAYKGQNEPYCEKNCYTPGMTFLYCLIGSGLFAAFIWSSILTNHLKLKHTVYIVLGYIAVSILANVHFGAQNHALPRS